jgi:hypothetical protein
MKKLNEQQMFRILTKILDKKEIANLAENIVFEDPDGTYHLYGDYSIQKNKDKYVLSKRGTFTVITFFNLRNAVIYTSFDKRNMIMDAKRIVELDILQEGTESSIQIYRNLMNKTKDLEKKTIYSAKFNEGRNRKTNIERELSIHALNSKKWQERMFNQVTK